jgi:hypothetical protein
MLRRLLLSAKTTRPMRSNFDIGRRENHQTLGRFDSRQQPHSLMLGALKFPTTINRGPLR